MPKFYPLKVKRVTKETEDAVCVGFSVPEELQEAFDYIPGQYLTFKHPHQGKQLRRSYSICSALYENKLEVAIKKVPGGIFSTYANEELKEGDQLEVMTPMGSFCPKELLVNGKNYVAFAAGSGITPVISIIKSVLKNHPESQFVLFFGNKYSSSIIFKEELEALKNTYMERFSLHHILSREAIGSELFTGRISGEKCRQFSSVFFNPENIGEYFLCGPYEMVNSVTEYLKEIKVEPKKIHFELFTSPLLVQQQKNKAADVIPDLESEISITLDGNTVDFGLNSKAENILDAALKNGADLPFACKGGVCCTCKAKVIEGEVAMEVNYGLEPDEIEAGYVLSCQAHPVTKKVVLDFDA